MKYIFKAEKVVFEDQPGYMFYQYREDGVLCVDPGFTPEEEFENFLSAAGINQSEIIFL